MTPNTNNTTENTKQEQTPGQDQSNRQQSQVPGEQPDAKVRNLNEEADQRNGSQQNNDGSTETDKEGTGEQEKASQTGSNASGQQK